MLRRGQATAGALDVSNTIRTNERTKSLLAGGRRQRADVVPTYCQ